MYATVTRLTFDRDEHAEAALLALGDLIAGLEPTAGVKDCYVVETAARELVLFSAYDSAAAASAASAALRPAIAAEVGSLVAGPPSRREGRVVVRRSWRDPGDA